MDLLYTVTIQPLELLYKFLYIFLARVTDTYGLSLLCLSMVSYAVFHPLKKLTAAMRERESRARALMAPQLAAIKKESRGAERQARTAALYRRYAYHPLLALRSSAGILLQVPFLFAAYAMINAFEPIRGQGAFGLIPDLGAPDGLLGGLNALPLIMTGVNLLAVFTTRGFARGDKLQGSLIALLFLALLYPAPSALLIYWTGNNILMLLENGLRGLARFRPARAPRKTATDTIPPAPAANETPTIAGFLKAALPACAAVFAIPAIMALRSFSYGKLSSRNIGGDLSGFEAVLSAHQAAGILILLLAAVWAGRRISRLPPRPRPFLYALIAGMSLWSFYTLGRILARGDDFSPTLIWLFYDVLTASLGVCLVIGTDWRGCLLKCQNALAAGTIPRLFAFSSLALALTLGFLSPYALYNSSPEHFGVPFSQVLGSLLPYMVLFLFLCFLLHLALPSAWRPWLACAWLGLALLVFFNSTIFTGDYGALSHVSLEKSHNLSAPLRGATDVFIFLLIFLILLAVYYFRAARIALFCLTAACAAMLLTAAVVSCLDPEVERWNWTADSETPGEAPLERGKPLSLSKTQPNILVFFLDMFTGGHVEDILDEYPGLIPRFAGFTWYPDTMAVGERTDWSIPSIMGGPAFTPDLMNQRPDSTLADKYTEAAAVLPRAFGARGYATTYLNHTYRFNNPLLSRLSNGTPPRVEWLPRNALRRRWEQIIRPGSASLDATEVVRYPTEFVLLLSLFKATPHTRKAKVYNYGLWLPDVLAQSGLIQHSFSTTLYESAVLGLLPELAGTEAEQPTLTILLSGLPHSPWQLPKDSLIPVENPYPATKATRTHSTMVDGVIPAHVYTETHILRLLADFFDWLRTEGLYDNTMIVLISDHCDGDSRMLNAALGVDERGVIAEWRKNNAYPGRPHALLMWKRFNDNAPFRRAPDLMSSLDVPALVCTAIDGCPDVERQDTGPGRVRVHYYDVPSGQIDVPGKKTYDAWKKAVVRGTMFRLENWSRNE